MGWKNHGNWKCLFTSTFCKINMNQSNSPSWSWLGVKSYKKKKRGKKSIVNIISLVWTSYKNAIGSNKFTNETDMEVWNHKGFQCKNQIYCYAHKLYELYPMYDPRTYEMHRAIPTMLYTSSHNTSRCTGKWYLILRKVCTDAYIGRQVIACTVAL